MVALSGKLTEGALQYRLQIAVRSDNRRQLTRRDPMRWETGTIKKHLMSTDVAEDLKERLTDIHELRRSSAVMASLDLFMILIASTQ